MIRVFYYYFKSFLKSKSLVLLIYFLLSLGLLYTYHLISPDVSLLEYGLGCLNSFAYKDIMVFVEKMFYILFLIYISLLYNKYLLELNEAYLFFRTSKKNIVRLIVLIDMMMIFLIDFIIFMMVLLIKGLVIYNINFYVLMKFYIIKLLILSSCLFLRRKFYIIILGLEILIYLGLY